MKEISILALVWDSFNEAHIWERHQLTRAEVENTFEWKTGTQQSETP